MGITRVSKKLVPALEGIDAAILMVNASDPQFATIYVFYSAIEHLSYITILNKTDMVSKPDIRDIILKLKGEVIPASIVKGRGISEIEYRLSQWKNGSKVAVLGVFNSGKTSLINILTDGDEPVGDLPGTTLVFTPHTYKGITLIDTVGQVVDVSKPMMVCVDLEGCTNVRSKLERVMTNDARAITESIVGTLKPMIEATRLIMECVEKGGKIITCGAGASALVAMEMAGQGQETGLPMLVFTNNTATMMPVSFAKGLGEDEAALAEYIVRVVNPEDVLIGVSASGGTGFVYATAQMARNKGAKVVSITENSDTPLGKASDIIIKSDGKPEGPSSGPVQMAHMAIGHALILTIADERGVSAEDAINLMLSEFIATKKMGIK